MGLKPLGDRVLVKVEESENALPSGLVIPDTAKEKPQEGRVLAVGPGSYHDGQRIPLDVKEGDRILFSKYGGTEVKVGGEELMILNERDVLAVVD
ncbi:MAG TPA: co-chaperone GroES [Actinomycetota bacterium]|nr:co-chaperone GroES [Actinomycetota bacterium]